MPQAGKGFRDAVVDGFTNLYNGIVNLVSGNNEGTAEAKGQGKTQEGDNTNPYEGPVDKPVNVVDKSGNVVPVRVGEQASGSKDSNAIWIQVKDKNNKPTGIRKDGTHGPNHKPEGQKPHTHRPDVPGTPHWLDINP